DRDGIYVLVATREGVEDGTTAGNYELSMTAGEAALPPAATPVDGELLYFDIRSYTAMDICEVYVSPSSDPEWGENLLRDVLTNGNLLELRKSPGLYDVLVVGCNGTELEKYEINAERSLAVEVYDNDLYVHVYPR